MADDFERALKNPCLLNFVSGLFAVERTYDCMGIVGLNRPLGHLFTVSFFLIGFLVGLLTLMDKPPKYFDPCCAKWFSYALLVAGSLSLLVVLFCDVLGRTCK